jgi:hypothetical protein
MANLSDDDDYDARISSTLRRFSSTKGAVAKPPKVDKRSETSKANMAKARAAKLAGLQAKKETRAQQVEESEEEGEDSEDSEDSDDDTDFVITKGKPQKGKGKGRAAPPAPPVAADPRLDLLWMLAQKGMQKTKKKAPVRKTNIHVHTPAAPVAAPVVNQKVEALRQSCLNF